MIQVPQPKVIQLHKKQYEAFNFPTQFCAAIAGVRGGKTFVGAAWAGWNIANTEGNGLIVGPDYKTLQSATLPTFFSLFPSYQKYYKEQKSVIEIPATKTTPAKLIFIRSMDDPLSVEGITASWCWADEAGKYKLMAWTVLRSRVSLAKGKIFLTTTPYNMGWLYTDFYKQWAEKTDPDYTVVTWTSVDNPYFPPEVYAAERKRLTPAEFKRRYEGGFSRPQGLVYDVKSIYLVDPVLPASMAADITLGGLDWGWTHQAALIIIKLFRGVYYLVDEWYMTGKTTPQIIEEAMRLQNKWGVNRWYADSANPEKIAEANTNTGLQMYGYEKQKDSISHGVNTINQLMLDNRFFIFRGMRNTLDEFESYQYPEPDDTGRVVKDEPMPFNNHLMDAMRYAIMGYQPARRAKVPQPLQDGETYTNVEISRMLIPTGPSRNGRNEQRFD